MIAEFFNQNNIQNRLKNWTGSSISTIVTTDPVSNKRKINEVYDCDSDIDEQLLIIKSKSKYSNKNKEV